jgi:glutamate-1-semialdehyde 2,1-aminomutase
MRRPPREFRDTATTSSQSAVLKELTRFFGRHGIVLPNAAAACLSTPMEEGEVDMVCDVFALFLQEHSAQIAAMETVE